MIKRAIKACEENGQVTSKHLVPSYNMAKLINRMTSFYLVLGKITLQGYD